MVNQLITSEAVTQIPVQKYKNSLTIVTTIQTLGLLEVLDNLTLALFT